MQGFSGRVFCTAGTQDLCRIVLPDSGRIQEEDAANANRHGFSRHEPALPLYGEADAFRAVSLLQPVGYERPMPVAAGVEVDFISAGHLLGSAYARVRVGGTTILFGGDLGRYDRPVLPDPVTVERADYLLVESTYGNRVHEDDDDGESAGGGDSRDRRTRRQADHPGVRDRARRGAALLDRPARRAEADPGAAGVRRQPDGAGGARALHRAHQRARSRAAAGEARREGAATTRPRTSRSRSAGPGGSASAGVCAFCTTRFRAIESSRGIEAAHAVAHAGHRHLIERDGHRRPRAAPLEGRAAEPAQHGAARRLPGGRHARAAAASTASRTVKIHGQQMPVQAHIDHDRVDVGARRFARKSCAGSAASQRRPGARSSCTASRQSMDALGGVDRPEARLERPHAAPG